jgi:hypothetical protein
MAFDAEKTQRMRELTAYAHQKMQEVAQMKEAQERSRRAEAQRQAERIEIEDKRARAEERSRRAGNPDSLEVERARNRRPATAAPYSKDIPGVDPAATGITHTRADEEWVAHVRRVSGGDHHQGE